MRPDLMLRPDSFRQALDRKVAVELLEVRLMVEPEAAALAAVRASSNDLERIRRDVSGLRATQALTKRPPEDLGFHLDVVRAAHNGALLRISSAIIAFYEHDEGIPTKRDYDEHLAVLKAMEVRDADGARRAMKAHLDVEMKVHTEGPG
jgi:DNA-binding FadR family transcriptional regulator